MFTRLARRLRLKYRHAVTMPDGSLFHISLILFLGTRSTYLYTSLMTFFMQFLNLWLSQICVPFPGIRSVSFVNLNLVMGCLVHHNLNGKRFPAQLSYLQSLVQKCAVDLMDSFCIRSPFVLQLCTIQGVTLCNKKKYLLCIKLVKSQNPLHDQRVLVAKLSCALTFC